MSQPFSTSPGEPNHEQITDVGLSFLRPELRAALVAANVVTDVEHFFDSANHFDACNFSGGAEVVRQSQAEAVQLLDPKKASPENDARAIRAFGRSLHALQDFYAHSNWVELGGETLVDDSLRAFPSLRPYSTLAPTGFVVVQGNPPKQATLERDETAAYPDSARARIQLGKALQPALISGSVDYEPTDYCPPSVAMSHDELNKDDSTDPERLRQHEAARTLAILQTEHEWCRLRALARAKFGPKASARLDAWVAPGASAPACK